MNQAPLLASASIKRLMHEYCTAIDHGDFKRFGLLMKGARWLVEGEPPSPESATNVIVYDDDTPRTKHVISNIDITLADSGSEATATLTFRFTNKRQTVRSRSFLLANTLTSFDA